MDKKDVELIDKLFLEKTAYDLIMGYIDAFIFPNKPGDNFEEFNQSITRHLYKENLDLVFKFAESPIEKIFLNALLLQNLMHGTYLIKYTEPIHPVYEVVNKLRDNYTLIMYLWQRFQEVNGSDEDGKKFMSYILDAPELSTDDKNLIMHHMLYEHALKHINAFHVSLQCHFDEITVNGKHIRPDIFIWVPSRPEFKLVVECDGFQYHSDRHAFTNDRERDRILRDNGFQVLRFSGQEIVNDPIYKARELLNYLSKLQQEMFKEELLEDSLFVQKASH